MLHSQFFLCFLLHVLLLLLCHLKNNLLLLQFHLLQNGKGNSWSVAEVWISKCVVISPCWKHASCPFLSFVASRNPTHQPFPRKWPPRQMLHFVFSRSLITSIAWLSFESSCSISSVVKTLMLTKTCAIGKLLLSCSFLRVIFLSPFLTLASLTVRWAIITFEPRSSPWWKICLL